MALIETLIAGAMAGAVLWFYPHCARPGLALAGGRPLAFWLVVISTAVSFAASVVLLVAGLIQIDGPLNEAASRANLLFVVPALAFLRPAWLVRITGGADASVPVRYVLTWFRSRWPRVQTPVDADRFRAGLVGALESLDEPVERAIVDHWIREMEALGRATRTGPTTFGRHREQVSRELAAVVPVDIVGRWMA